MRDSAEIGNEDEAIVVERQISKLYEAVRASYRTVELVGRAYEV
jgi:hypothetical protein